MESNELVKNSQETKPIREKKSKDPVFIPEDMARLINEYLRDIMSVFEKENGYRYLYGSAVSIRKLVEALASYLLEKQMGPENTPTEQKEVPLRQRLGNQRQLRRFTDQYDRVLPDPKTSSAGPQRLLHYQSVNEPSETYRDHEKEQLLFDYQSYHQHVFNCINTVVVFFSFASEVKQYVVEHKGLKYIHNWVFPLGKDPKGNYERLAEMADPLSETAVENINAIYENKEDPLDPWLNWHCLILEEITAEKSQVSCSTCAIICRKIAERSLSRKAWELGCGDSLPANAMTEDMVQKYKKDIVAKLSKEVKVGKIGKDVYNVAIKDIPGHAEMITARANSMVHFNYSDQWNYDRPDQLDEKNSELFDKEYEILLGSTSTLVDKSIVEEHPMYAWHWVAMIQTKGYDRKAAEELEKQNQLLKEQYKNLKEWFVAVLLVALIAVITFISMSKSQNERIQAMQQEKDQRETIFTEYYADYIWRDGAPEGLVTLSEEQARTQSHYVFQVQDNKVQSVRLADAAGNTMNEILSFRTGRPAKIEVEYSGEQSSRVTFFDADSRFQLAATFERDYKTKEINAIRLADQEGYDLFLPADITNINLESWLNTADDGKKARYSGISGLEVTKNKNGQIQELHFGLKDDQKDENDFSGLAFETDEDGRVTEIKYLYDTIQENEKKLEKTLFYFKGEIIDRIENIYSDNTSAFNKYDYSQDGKLIREIYTTATGAPNSNKEDVAEVQYNFDQKGRIHKIIHLGSDGQLIAGSEGWATVTYSWDERGRKTETFYTDAFDRSVVVGNWAREVISYENNKRTICWYGKDDQPAYKDAGYVTRIDTETKTADGYVHLYERFDEKGTRVLYQGAYQWERTFDSQGDTILVRALDGSGKLMFSDNNAYALVETTYNRHKPETRVYKDEKNNLTDGNRGYARREITYTKSMGSEDTIKDYNSAGEVVRCVKYDYEADTGRRIRESFLDMEGKPTTDPQCGYSWVEYQYQKVDNGVLKRTTYYDADNKPVMVMNRNENQYAINETIYDDNNIFIDEAFFDEQNNPVCIENGGYHRVKIERDGRGNALSISYFDEHGKPMTGEKGYASVKQEYDKNNNVIRKEYYGPDGNLIIPESYGFAVCVNKYDDATGNYLGVAFFDTGEKPIAPPSSQYASLEYTYDDSGNMLTETYRDENGNLVISPKVGYAAIIQKYDQEGHKLERTYIGEDGHAMILPGKGYATCRNTYENGNVTSWSFYDEYDRAMIVEGYGYAKKVFLFTDDGKNNGYLFYGPDESLMIVPSIGAAGKKWDNDSMGNCIHETWLGTDQKPFYNEKEGYASARATYNEENREISSSFYDVNDKLIINPVYGFATREKEYDQDGNVILIRYLNTNNQLMLNPQKGYAIYAVEFSDSGKKKTVSYYGEQNCLTVIDEGYARYEEIYNDKGETIGWSYYGSDGEPIISPKGYAKIEREFDDQGRVIEERFYDENNKLFVSDHHQAIRRWKYGEDGKRSAYYTYNAEGKIHLAVLYKNEKEADIQYYDDNGQPAFNEKVGYSRKTLEYDNNGNTICICFYDAQGNMLINPSLGYAKLTEIYDNDNRIEQVRYYGDAGQLIYLDQYGYCGYNQKYDEEGHIARKTFIGEDGRPAPLYNENPVTIQYTCDSNGKVLTETYLDEEDLPVDCPSQNFSYGKAFVYDDEGNIISEAYLNIDKTLLTADPEEYTYDYSMRLYEYDDQRRLTAITLCDHTGTPFVSETMGYCTKRSTYNDDNTLHRVDYYDILGRLLVNEKTHCASVVYIYNSQGEKETTEYYDAEGRMIHSETMSSKE